MRVRFRVDVTAEAPEIPWDQVFSPARSFIYTLIRDQDAELATELHDQGWQGHTLRPVGISCPQFRGARRVPGRYTTSGTGSLWFGSPIPRIAGMLLAGVTKTKEIRWGHIAFGIRGVQVETPADHSTGGATVRTATPVLIKHESRYITPDHGSYQDQLRHNLVHKADLLGLPNDVVVEVLDAGPVRHFAVQGVPRIGTTLTTRVHAAPEFLDAIYAWGLGLTNNQGFGWIR